MTHAATSTAARVESILCARMRQIGQATKYTSKFDTQRGRRLMLKRAVNFRGAFAERFPGNGAIPGVRLHVSKQTPGHYMPGDARAESIAKDPKLGLGCEAFYVEFDEDAAVERFIDWYEKQ